MQIQPFRVSVSDDPDNYNTIYNILFIGSARDPYKTEIEIDEFNDEGIKGWRCDCKDFEIRKKDFPEKCKHIDEFINVLKQFGITNEKETKKETKKDSYLPYL